MKMEYLIFLVVAIILIWRIVATRSSMKKRDDLGTFVNRLSEKYIFNNCYISDPTDDEEGPSACDVCIVKGGIIIFKIASSLYFYQENLDETSFRSMSAKCAPITKLYVKEKRFLYVDVEYPGDLSDTSYMLKLPGGNYSLTNLLNKYSILTA